jgi:polar amino acid transport system substrate-binding protein
MGNNMYGLNRKIIPAVFGLFLLLAGVPAMWAQSQTGGPPPDIQRITERGTLIVAMFSQDIPPFFMHDSEGRFYGLDVEIARDIAEKLGVELEFNREAQSFDEIIEIVMRNEADLAISWLSRTLQRSELVRYTKPYIVLHQGLLINRRKIKELTDKDYPLLTLNQPGAVIGVRSGTSYESYAESLFPEAEIRRFPDWDPDIVEAVYKGELTAGYHDEIEIKKYVMGRPEASIRAATAIIQDLTDPIAIAVPWNSYALLDWLNLYIEDYLEEWTADKLLRHYEESLRRNLE